jgi:hypothetical protein
MASYSEHVSQANSNLFFLGKINNEGSDHIDWQVTTCFYVGVHIINGFLAREQNMHFNSHENVATAIAPESVIQATRLPEQEYLAYVKLRNLSRRSRYLCQENGRDAHLAHLIEEKHFIKAFRHLDVLLNYFRNKYMENYPLTRITHPFTHATPHCLHFTFQVL